MEIDKLRPEIRDAVDSLDKSEGIDFAWLPVRAELLRLAGDFNEVSLGRDTYKAKYEAMRERAEQAEAELAAIKARIADAPTLVYGRDDWRHEALIGKRVRLLVEE